MEIPVFTLHRVGGGLGQVDMLSTDMVGWLVLSDLHTGAHVTLTMQEEAECA